jgi:cell division protein FtsI (penicillin-binding protein 3)
VAPLQAVGHQCAGQRRQLLIPPTFLKRTKEEARAARQAGDQAGDQRKMRYLMRLNAEKGTATKAEVKGYYVGGKTGTSEKVVNGRYVRNKLLTTFTAVLPADKPRYQILIMLDEPQP